MKIHTVLCAPLAVAPVRIFQHDALANTLPGVSCTAERPEVESPAGADVLVLQRPLLTRERLPRLRRYLASGALVVTEMDDCPERWPAHRESGYLAYRGVHAVQTSTEPLADCLRAHNSEVAVFYNCVAEAPGPRLSPRDGPLKLFFGALNREIDWAPYMRTLNDVLDEFGPRVRVRVVHDKLFFDELRTAHKDYVPFCAYADYLEILRDCDVAWLPLADDRFNRMKSDLKFVECAANGVAALCGTVVYGHGVHADDETYLTRIVYGNVDQFAVGLRRLLRDAALRHAMVRHAHEWVKGGRMQHSCPSARVDWYKGLLARKVELDAALRARVPELS